VETLARRAFASETLVSRQMGSTSERHNSGILASGIHFLVLPRGTIGRRSRVGGRHELGHCDLCRYDHAGKWILLGRRPACLCRTGGTCQAGVKGAHSKIGLDMANHRLSIWMRKMHLKSQDRDCRARKRMRSLLPAFGAQSQCGWRRQASRKETSIRGHSQLLR
jgi:hypothetical protein